jgi:PAS domain S-box-containing protein
MQGYIGQRASARRIQLSALRCATALLAVIVGALLADWMQPVLDPTVPLLMAVMVAAWFSGLWPALLAAVLATLVVDYFFTPPLHTISLEFSHIPRLAVFSVIAALFAGASASRRRAERALGQARDGLEVQVRQRTTDLSLAHTAALAAQQRFRDLVNSVPGLVWEANADTLQLTFMSGQVERILGYPADEGLLEAEFWRERLLHPDDRERVLDACRAAAQEGTTEDLEYRMRAAQGHVIWVRTLITAGKASDGVLTLRGVTVDVTERKKAEQTLREQAELLNLTHDTIFVRDAHDVIRYWNHGAEESYGWRSAEAVGQVSHELTQTVFPVPLSDITATLLRTDRWEGELVHTNRDGSQVVVASRWSLQRGADGQPIGILETNNDITERKRAETALRRSEQQWQAVFENNPTMYFMVDPAGTVLSVNPFGAEQLGYRVPEITGRPVSGVFLPEDHGTVKQALDQCLANVGQVFTWEIRKIRKDGTIIWVRETAKAMNRLDADPVVLIACEDVSARKHAEAEVIESERRYRHIFQGAAVSIWEEDFSAVKAALDRLRATGVGNVSEYIRQSPAFVEEAISLVRIKDVNDGTLKLFGASDKQALTESLHRVFTPESRDVFAGELMAIAEGRTTFEGETVLRKMNGEPMSALFSVSFPPPDGRFDTVLVSIMDITDRKRAEHELEELAGRLIHAQEEERSRIGRELHDHISQTLGVLTIRIDQLRGTASTPPDVANALGELRDNAAAIASDIHSLSHRLHSSALDYLGLVPAVQKLSKEFTVRHEIAVDFSHHSVPEAMSSDAALCLFRLTEESLTNVAKHSGAKSARVALTGAPDGIRLTIEDSGTGFDNASLSSRAGLGFVSMRERVRVLRGAVRVHTAPGSGTRIEAWIPAGSLAPGWGDASQTATAAEHAAH